MRSYTHITPRYVFDRIGEMVSQRLNPEAPWLTSQMVEILDAKLGPTDRGLEWGSGRSTVWFARRIAHLISVEHDAGWAEVVKTRLAAEGLDDRVAFHLLTYGASEQDESVADTAYVNIAGELPSESLDFCLVDGACRDYCALACLPKLKPGGLLVIDDVQRYIPGRPKSRAPNARGDEDGFASKVWEEVWQTISAWPCTWTTNGVHDTALWVKV